MGLHSIQEHDCYSKPITRDELGVLILAFLRRTVQDASGPELFDSHTTHEEQFEARMYLINGKLEKHGYYIYEGYETNYKRTYDARFIRFVETEDLQQSLITLNDIAQYVNIPYVLLKERVMSWKQAGWSKDHNFFKSVIAATRKLDDFD